MEYSALVEASRKRAESDSSVPEAIAENSSDAHSSEDNQIDATEHARRVSRKKTAKEEIIDTTVEAAE